MAKISAAQISPASPQVAINVRESTGFREWRLLLEGREDGPAVPASGFGRDVDLPTSNILHTYPGPGTYKPRIILRNAEGEEVTAETTVVVRGNEEPSKQGTVVPATVAATCATPLGTSLGILGLGDDELCVPADPCDLNPAELGLSQQGIQRPASCAGADAEIVEASEPAAPPRSARPTVLRQTLRLGSDRRVRLTVRCGSGPGACAGRVRVQIPASGGSPARTLGSITFPSTRPGARRRVSVLVPRALARTLRRRSSTRVRVTVTPSTQPGFTRPRADTATLLVTTSTARRT
ncbi:hypothetical protein LRS13_23100 [Svornostia abyssi]|uniref:PKD domain-containing protein n=1 Tax=Svornostia abyssi TaxID=2898438 RepID=A0ABY5PG35_9ACTN|nr:hypothetical protein LRS13_23100 [Parviterribacteraceae bacterium J379]